MDSSTYLLFNIIVFVPVLVLGVVSKIKIHRLWQLYALCIVLVSLPFMYWDIWATSQGHWDFNPIHVGTVRIAGVPIEEMLFFITVPFACIFVWEVVGRYVRFKRQMHLSLALWGMAVVGILATILLLANWGNGYTRTVMIATLTTVGLYARYGQSLLRLKAFWLYQLVLIFMFVIANSILTSLPIITYGSHAIIGVRIGTIPLEDFFFNFALINLWILVWENLKQRLKTKSLDTSNK